MNKSVFDSDSILAALGETDGMDKVNVKQVQDQAQKLIKRDKPIKDTNRTTTFYWPSEDVYLRTQDYLHAQKMSGERISASALLAKLLDKHLKKEGY